MGPSVWVVEALAARTLTLSISNPFRLAGSWLWGVSDDVPPDWFDVRAGRREDSGETVAVLLLAFFNMTFDECTIRSRIFSKIG